MPYRMTSRFFTLCLLCLVLPLLNACNKTEPVPVLTEEEQAEADFYIKEYSGRGYAEGGKDVLLFYLIRVDRKTPEKTVLKFAKYFVSQGADVNAKQEAEDSPDVHHRTPLHLAAGSNPDYSAKKNSINVDLVKYLVSKGADVNAQGGRGTPLHEAVRYSNVDVVKYLVSKKADVNAKNKDGETPLHIAAKSNFETKIAQYLVSKKADVNAGEKWGKTSLDIAEETGNQALAKYLSGKQSKKSGESTQQNPNAAAEKEIRDCFARYKAALLSSQGEEAAECVSDKTISYYFWSNVRTMQQDRKGIERMPLTERIYVLSMRHQVPYAKLYELSRVERTQMGRSYFIHAVESGMIGKESVEKLELAKVFVDTVDGNKAKTMISSDGKTAPFGFDFLLEEGQWKIDLTSFFPIAEEILKAAIMQSGMSENQFIFAVLEKNSGKKPDDSIWDPPKPTTPQDQEVVERIQRQERERLEKERRERIASGEMPSPPPDNGPRPIGRTRIGGRPSWSEEPEPQQTDDGNQNQPVAQTPPPANNPQIPDRSSAQPPREQPSRTRNENGQPRPPVNFETSLGVSTHGTAFSETTPDNGALVGFQVTFKKWGPNDCIESIQPLYRSLKSSGGKRGQVHGNAQGESKRVYAPEGYAVGAIHGRVGAVVDGFELTFMKIKSDGTLDTNDTRTSDWVGNNQPGSRKTINGNGKPVAEIKGYTHDYLSSLELVFQ
jgi:FOG: Ankyrin repeat